MSVFGNVAFDAETLAILEGVFDEAWASIQAQRNGNITRAALAKRILNLAVDGERNPARLVDGALDQRCRTTFEQKVTRKRTRNASALNRRLKNAIALNRRLKKVSGKPFPLQMLFL